MKKTQIAVFLGLLMTFSLAMLGTGMMASANATSISTPKAATAGFGFTTGDIFYYRSIENEDMENASVLKYIVTSVSESFMEFDMYIANPNNNYTFDFVEKKNSTYQPNDLVWNKKLGIATNISSMQTYNDTLENLNMRYLSDFGSYPTTAILSDGGAIYHRLEMTGVANITAVLNKTTGLTVYQKFKMGTDSEILELMGWESNNLVWDNNLSPDFGYVPGNELFQFEPNWNQNNDDYDEGEYSEPTAAPEENTTDSMDSESHWIKIKVKFVYFNPETNEQILVADMSVYSDPLMTTLIHEERLREMGRIIASDPTTSMGGEFFSKDLDLTTISTELNAFFTSSDGENLTNVNITLAAKHFDVEGFDDLGNLVIMQMDIMNNYGFSELFDRSIYNVTGEKELIDRKTRFTIKGPGVDEADPMIGVGIGDNWQTISSEEKYEQEYGNDYNNYWEEKQVVYEEVTVTHIFAANNSVMVVVGDIEMWTSVDPNRQVVKDFEPLLIFDSNNPETFITAAGWGELNHAPLLLPQVGDWLSYSTSIQDLINTTFNEDEDQLVGSHFTANSIRLKLKGEYESPERNVYSEKQYILEMDSHGIVTHMDSYEKKEESGDNWGSRRDNKMVVFVISSNLGCNSANPTDVTNIQSGDEFIWERSEYRNWDVENDPSHKDREKMIVDSLQTACDGSVLFLGERYYKGWDDTQYNGNYWQLGEETQAINFWILSSLKDNDVWSWFESQFYDTGISDFSTVADNIATILNFGMGAQLSASDVTTSGRSFQIEVADPSGEIMVFKFAANEEGVLQDMFDGRKYTNGTWIEWRRNVLVNSDRGAVGEVFTEGIPEDYVSADTDTDTTPSDNPFNVPGYPIGFLIVFGIGALALIVRKIRK